MQNAIDPFVKAAKAFLDTPGGARLHHTRRFIRQFDDIDELAFIVAKRLINAIADAEPIQRVAISLSNMLLDHLEYTKFKLEEPGFLRAVERNLQTAHQGHRRIVIMRAKRLIGIQDESWKEADKVHLGAKLIDLFIQSTGLVEKVRDERSRWILQGTDEAREWITGHHAKCELLSPFYMPMVVKPVPWTSPFGGGFLTNYATLRTKLVKTRNRQALEALSNHDMPLVYKAVNAVQDVPWRINRKVLTIIRQTWELDNGLGGLPRYDPEPLPPKPWSTNEEFEWMKEHSPASVKQWKIEATRVYTERIKTGSKRFALAQKIWLAEKFQDEPAFYFVWVLDWRGRMYPMQTYITPQSDDTGRALLEFAEGKPLGDTGAFWLAVHLANKFGNDKVPFQERVQWVRNHEALILDSAENPLDGLRFWAEADAPWQFLAAAIEWAGYKVEGKDYVSHLPIHLDGTCNGLQNYSAMLRDEIGGLATNLVPRNKPQDVYQEVADAVSRLVDADAAAGDEWAKLWVGKVDRSIAKRNVMTTPYGVGLYGMRQQLEDELQERNTGGGRYLETDDSFHATLYLAKKMKEAISQVVVAASHAMDWLQEAVRTAFVINAPIVWTTPAGFLVYQFYVKQRHKKVNTFWGRMALRHQLGIQVDTTELNRRKQANGIAPNFVHSLDASHLMLTVNKALGSGIKSFAFIHDSYATHAADTDRFSRIIREAFVEQYEQDVLQQFANRLKAQLPKDVADKLPSLPKKGKLDLQAVLQSGYFFA